MNILIVLFNFIYDYILLIDLIFILLIYGFYLLIFINLNFLFLILHYLFLIILVNFNKYST
jgi:hypothetical protein